MPKVSDTFNVQCLEFWYRFLDNHSRYIWAHCLHSVTNYTKSKRVDRTNFNFFPSRTIITWGIVSQTYCWNILGFNPKGQQPHYWIVCHSTYIVRSYSYECTDIKCYSCERNIMWFLLFCLYAPTSGELYFSYSYIHVPHAEVFISMSICCYYRQNIHCHQNDEYPWSCALPRWPLYKRIIYSSYQAFSLHFIYHHVDFCNLV